VEAPWPVRWREATGKISDFERSGRSAQTATQPAGCGGKKENLLLGCLIVCRLVVFD